jgi:hypothetical protein
VSATNGLAAGYIDDGFVVVPDLLSADELDEIRADALTIARGGYPGRGVEPVDASVPDDEVMAKTLAIHFPHYASPVMRRYVSHPGVVDVLTAITGAHLPHWDGRVKCMQSMVFFKGPGQPGQAWHQDEAFIPTRDRSLLGAWMALDDATVDNGCLWVRPGSHRTGYLFPQRDHGQPDEFDFSPGSYGFDDDDEVPVEVTAGSVIFFNGYLLHRSKRNRSPRYRRALVNHYMNAWSLLPWMQQADFRSVVPVAGEDPYAWKGYPEPDLGLWVRPSEA